MEEANKISKESQQMRVRLQVDHLMALCLNDKTKLDELIRSALPVVINSIVELNQSLQQNNIKIFLREIHKLKGSLGVLEPEILYPEAKTLEVEYQDLDQVEKHRRASLFIRHLDSLREELEKVIS